VADNVQLNLGAGGVIAAADDVGGFLWQRIKVGHGADGSATDVSLASPLPTRSTGASSSVAAVPANAASVTVLASNANRLRAWLYNDSDKIAYVKLGAAAVIANSFTKKLLPQQDMEVQGYTGVIDCIWAAGPTGNMLVTELTP